MKKGQTRIDGIDIEGTDLYVFEVGPDVEATFLAVSANGSD
ncbi:hypothetical protein [Loktanella sp. SALINAS62]|nr:hypothetical protein [Loktanella sp. SALINAS62]